MIERLLVPLDGSQLAEKVLPVVKYLAGATHSIVHLIHVVEKNAPVQVHNQMHLTNGIEAETYLGDVRSRLGLPEGSVALHVHSDGVTDVTRAIISHAEHELPSDLIVMCTHGHGGARRFLYGSIAQQVAASGRVPVLFVKPEYPMPEGRYVCRKIVAPVDLTLAHEPGLHFAIELAKVCSAQLRIVTVVPTRSYGKWAQVGRLLPSASSKAFEIAVEQASEYVDKKAKQACAESVKAEGEVLRGDPPDLILDTAISFDTDLIIMGTHGTAGMDAFWESSVASEVCTRTDKPVILVPV